MYLNILILSMLNLNHIVIIYTIIINAHLIVQVVKGDKCYVRKENIVKDLKLSQDKLNGSYYFAYPFFDFNDNAKAALKEAGFRMAFIGQWNTNGYSTYDTDRLMIRRKTIFGNLKLNKFIEYLK